MTKDELKLRTKKFAVVIIFLSEKLDKKYYNTILFNQLIRSATSVGANYRSACRAKSDADFSYKIKIVEEEADESCYWLELLLEVNKNNLLDVELALKESKELTAIFSAIAIKLKIKAQEKINSKSNK
jgi:four helix bundle protein